MHKKIKKKWELHDRVLVFDSRFVKVYEDSVILPNGKNLTDYTVVEKPDIVIIVATTTSGDVIVLDEYKHGAQKVMPCLPAGHKPKDESAIAAAQRELTEETGYAGGTWEEIGILYDYPSKDIHHVYVVRAKEVTSHSTTMLEETESSTWRLVSKPDLSQEIKEKKWQTSSSLAAILLAELLP